MFEEILISSLKESIAITGLIFILMIIVEAFVLRFKESIISFLKKRRFLEYGVSSFFGIIPGCMGTFAMDSLYMAGLIGFGGIVAVMVATSGDEAFLMMSLAMKGEISWGLLISLTALLFSLGIFAGYLADFYLKKSGMVFCDRCDIVYHKKQEKSLKHFLSEHVYGHIVKKHIWRIFLWIFGALAVINLFNGQLNMAFSEIGGLGLLLIASLVGLLPISGPNVFLIMLFSKGFVPFSVLLANSIIQDGHGLLPIMGFSLNDAIKIKIFNFAFGFIIGLILLLLGI